MLKNTLERKILYQLDNNARATFQELAKACHTNRNVVAYHIKKFEEAGIIRGYFAEINNTALELEGFRIFFRFTSYDVHRQQEFVTHLLKDKRIAWAFSAKGIWDLDVIYWCKNRFEFYDLLEEIKLRFNDFLAKTEVSTIVNIYHYPKTYLVEKKRSSVVKKQLGRTNQQLSEGENLLLRTLAHHARKDILTLSRETKMSINTLKKYLKQLLEKKIILGFRPFIDINALGFKYFKLHLNLQNYTSEELKSLITFLEYDAHLVYLDFYINGADIEIEYHLENEERIDQKVDLLKEKFGKILKEYFVLKFEKEYVVRYLPEK